MAAPVRWSVRSEAEPGQLGEGVGDAAAPEGREGRAQPRHGRPALRACRRASQRAAVALGQHLGHRGLVVEARGQQHVGDAVLLEALLAVGGAHGVVQSGGELEPQAALLGPGDEVRELGLGREVVGLQAAGAELGVGADGGDGVEVAVDLLARHLQPHRQAQLGGGLEREGVRHRQLEAHDLGPLVALQLADHGRQDAGVLGAGPHHQRDAQPLAGLPAAAPAWTTLRRGSAAARWRRRRARGGRRGGPPPLRAPARCPGGRRLRRPQRVQQGGG